MMEQKKGIALGEDWLAVIFGFLIIDLVVFGFRIPVPNFNWENIQQLPGSVLSKGNVEQIGIQFIIAFSIAVFCLLLLRKPVLKGMVTFVVVYFLTVFALILAGNNGMKALNLEAVIFSLLVGLLIGNLFNLPEWFRSTLSTELFVKIGLVLLGTGIIFGDILKAGALGLVQALIVVFSVWYFAYWICKKLKIDEELSMMISSAVSICGVSAAIATAGAIKGDPKKLSYVISLVLITAIPMMLLMPYAANSMDLSQEVSGAWLGGTIDTTGAVVASGTLIGDIALKISTIVKFSQNVLLGLAAFVISIYWTYSRKTPQGQEATKPSLRLLWDRFPKFVLGFIAASLLFSFIIDKETVAAVKDSLKSIQSLWFVLAFTSIGLETKFSEIINKEQKRPLYAFLIAQVFNIMVTLVIAYLLFS
jgi:uncharacterized integral membrane protein (TIGR00698 family)